MQYESAAKKRVEITIINQRATTALFFDTVLCTFSIKMKEILEKYCTIKENFSNQFIPSDDVVLYQYRQGFEFMYVCGLFVELRFGFTSAFVYHNFKEKEKLQMFFDSMS